MPATCTTCYNTELAGILPPETIESMAGLLVDQGIGNDKEGR